MWLELAILIVCVLNLAIGIAGYRKGRSEARSDAIRPRSLHGPVK